nr:hypothetical protein Ade03nite_66470 [Actinoplanes derwentensis]
MAVDGRLVWIKPRPHSLTALGNPVTDGRYGIAAASTTIATSVGSAREKSLTDLGAELIFYAASAALSRFLFTVPAMSVSSGREHGWSQSLTVLSGRTTAADGMTEFTGELSFDVTVDGEPVAALAVPPADGDFVIRFPRQYAEAPRRPDFDSRAENDSGGHRAAGGSRETLNAVDVSTLVRGLHRHLATTGDLTVEAKATLARQITADVLNERALRAGSIAALSNGVVSDPIPVPSGTTVQVRVQLRPAGMQYLAGETVPPVTVYENRGIVRGFAQARESGIEVSVSSTGFVRGLTAAPATIVDGNLIGELEGGVQRGNATALKVQSGSRDSFTTTGEQHRYRTEFAGIIEFLGAETPVPPVTGVVEGELGVLDRDRHDFEQQHFGRTLPDATSPLIAVPPPPPVQLSDPLDDRQLGERIGAPLPDAPHLRAIGARTAVAGVPPVLAAGRGHGEAVETRWTGIDRVLPAVEAMLRTEARHYPATSEEWARAARVLATAYGQDALEAAPDRLWVGAQQDFELGGRTFHVVVTAHPGRIGDERAPDPVTADSQVHRAPSMTAATSSSASVTAELAGQARLGDGGLRVLGGAGVSVKGEWGSEKPITAGAKASVGSTIETGDGVTVPTVVSVAVSMGDQTPVVRVIEGPEIVEHVSVPGFFPADGTAPAEVTVRRMQLGVTAGDRVAPIGEHGASGIRPFFGNLPELSAAVAELWARTHLITANPMTWPAPIRILGEGGTLATVFRDLVDGRGAFVPLGRRGDIESAAHITMTVINPESSGTDQRGEITRSSQRSHESGVEKSAKVTAGVLWGGGGQAGIGYRHGDDDDMRGSDRVLVTGGREEAWEFGTSRGRQHGMSESGEETTRGLHYRASAVLEVRVLSWNAGSLPSRIVPALRQAAGDLPMIRRTRTIRLRADNALTFLTDHRLASLIGLPGVDPAGPPTITRTLLDPDLARALSQVEHIAAPRLLDRIAATLSRWNIAVDAPYNLLNSQLDETFRPNRMESAHFELLGSGLLGWFPVLEGARTGYLIVEARVPADARRPRGDHERPGVTSTQGSEGTDADEESAKYLRASGRFIRSRVRTITEEGPAGGVSQSSGWGTAAGSTQGKSTSTDTSEERTASSDDMVEFLEDITVDLHIEFIDSPRRLVEFVLRSFRSVRDRVAASRQQTTPWTVVLREPAQVPGSIRYVVPSYVTATGTGGGQVVLTALPGPDPALPGPDVPLSTADVDRVKGMASYNAFVTADPHIQTLALPAAERIEHLVSLIATGRPVRDAETPAETGIRATRAATESMLRPRTADLLSPRGYPIGDTTVRVVVTGIRMLHGPDGQPVRTDFTSVNHLSSSTSPSLSAVAATESKTRLSGYGGRVLDTPIGPESLQLEIAGGRAGYGYGIETAARISSELSLGTKRSHDDAATTSSFIALDVILLAEEPGGRAHAVTVESGLRMLTSRDADALRAAVPATPPQTPAAPPAPSFWTRVRAMLPDLPSVPTWRMLSTVTAEIAADEIELTPITPRGFVLPLLSDNDGTPEALRGITSPRGSFTVVAHGTPDGITVDGEPITPEQLATIIQGNENYRPGQPVVLIACDTGLPRGYAARLAALLPPGTTVTAPAAQVWTTTAGQAFVTAPVEHTADGRPRPQLPPTGTWTVFTHPGDTAEETGNPYLTGPADQPVTPDMANATAWSGPTRTELAERYEEILSQGLYTNERVAKVARRIGSRVHQVLSAATVDPTASFVSGDVRRPGAVGEQLTAGELATMLREGNVREVMTATRNALIAPGGRSFVDLAMKLVERQDWARAERFGLNVEKMKEHRRYLDNPARARALQLLKDKGVHDYPEAPDHPTTWLNMTATGPDPLRVAEDLDQLWPIPRDGAVEHRTTRRQLHHLGMGLSRREASFLAGRRGEVPPLVLETVDVRELSPDEIPYDEDGRPDLTALLDADDTVSVSVEYAGQSVARVLHRVRRNVEHAQPWLSWTDRPGPELPLPSMSGRSRFRIEMPSPRAEHLAAQGVPLATGLSGTTARMMTVFSWLNLPNTSKDELLVVLIAWQLATGNHSLYEVVRAAEVGGRELVPGGVHKLESPYQMYSALRKLNVHQLLGDAAAEADRVMEKLWWHPENVGQRQPPHLRPALDPPSEFLTMPDLPVTDDWKNQARLAVPRGFLIVGGNGAGGNVISEEHRVAHDVIAAQIRTVSKQRFRNVVLMVNEAGVSGGIAESVTRSLRNTTVYAANAQVWTTPSGEAFVSTGNGGAPVLPPDGNWIKFTIGAGNSVRRQVLGSFLSGARNTPLTPEMTAATRWSPVVGFTVVKGLFNTNDTPEVRNVVRTLTTTHGVYTVVAHGTADGIVIDGRTITAEELAENVQNDGDYTPGQPIILVACDTGIPDGYASRFARLMPSGTIVIAPNATVWTTPSGQAFVTPTISYDLDDNNRLTGRTRPAVPPVGTWTAFDDNGRILWQDGPYLRGPINQPTTADMYDGIPWSAGFVLPLLSDNDGTPPALHDVTAPHGSFTVVAHGTPDGITVDGEPITPEQLATIIQGNKNYRPGQPVVLIACDTGLPQGYAARLAALLPPGTTVTAPATQVWTTAAGQAFVTAPVDHTPDGRPRPQLPPTGTWTVFTHPGDTAQDTGNPYLTGPADQPVTPDMTDATAGSGPTRLELAEKYEEILGRGLATNELVKTVARRTGLRLLKVLGDSGHRNTADSFGTDDFRWAGAIGERVTRTELETVFKDGGIREVMNAVWHAMVNTDTSSTFAGVAMALIRNNDWTTAERYGLNVTEMKKFRAFLDSPVRRQTVQALFARGVEFTQRDHPDDPTAMINIVATGPAGMHAAEDLAQPKKIKRTDDQYRTTRKQLHHLGMGLSTREAAFLNGQRGVRPPTLELETVDVRELSPNEIPYHRNGQPDLSALLSVNDTVSVSVEYAGNRIAKVLHRVRRTVEHEQPWLSWTSGPGPELPLPSRAGRSGFKIDLSSERAEELTAKGIPLATGLSGSTARMMKMFSWLNVDGINPYEFLAALTGWMLTSHNHSLYEVIHAVEAAGLPVHKDGVHGLENPVDLYEYFQRRGWHGLLGDAAKEADDTLAALREHPENANLRPFGPRPPLEPRSVVQAMTELADTRDLERQALLAVPRGYLILGGEGQGGEVLFRGNPVNHHNIIAGIRQNANGLNRVLLMMNEGAVAGGVAESVARAFPRVMVFAATGQVWSTPSGDAFVSTRTGAAPMLPPNGNWVGYQSHDGRLVHRQMFGPFLSGAQHRPVTPEMAAANRWGPQAPAGRIAVYHHPSDDATTRRVIRGLTVPRGALTIVAHGTSHGIQVNGKILTAEELAAEIRKDKDYTPGQPIVLVACETGFPAGYAARLATLLPAGTTVTAPSTLAWTTASGQAFVTPSTGYTVDGRPMPRIPPTGTWTVFNDAGKVSRRTGPYLSGPADQQVAADMYHATPWSADLTPADERYLEAVNAETGGFPSIGAAERDGAATAVERIRSFGDASWWQLWRADPALTAWQWRNAARINELTARMNTAQITALHLYSRSDSALINLAMRNPGDSGPVFERVRKALLANLDAYAEDAEGLPGVLRNDPVLSALRGEWREAAAQSVEGARSPAEERRRLRDFKVQQRTTDMRSEMLQRLDELRDDLDAEMRVHGDRVVEALRPLPAVSGRTVYRGMRWPGRKIGDEFTETVLTSGSRSRDVAFGFAAETDSLTVMSVRLTGHSGRDIDIFSAYGFENEVLLMPGARFRVTDIGTYPYGRFQIPLITVVEIEPLPTAPVTNTPPGDDAETNARRERQLAVDLYHDPRMVEVARATAQRLLDVFDRVGPRALRVFTKDETPSAGQIGTSVSEPDLRAMLATGDLREVMTAVWNGIYYNDKAVDRTFARLVGEIVANADWARAGELGLDVPALRAYRQFLSSSVRGEVQRAMAGHGLGPAARSFGPDDPTDAINIIARSSSWQEATIDQVALKRAQRARTDNRFRTTRREIHQLGMGLSRREETYLRGGVAYTRATDQREVENWKLAPISVDTVDTTSYTADDIGYHEDGSPDLTGLLSADDTISVSVEFDGDIATRESISSVVLLSRGKPHDHVDMARSWIDGIGPELPLPWTTGQSMWQLDESSDWFRKRHEAGIPLLAGTSLTTSRLLVLFDWLNVPGVSRREFVLASAAWMISSNDHSLYEVLMGAEIAGFSISGTSSIRDLTRPETMYEWVAEDGRTDVPAATIETREPTDDRTVKVVLAGSEDTASQAAGARFPHRPGHYTVVAHGDRDGIPGLSPSELKARIESDDRFRGQPITLAVCDAGLPGGYAATLSGLMPGVEIHAPDGLLWSTGADAFVSPATGYSTDGRPQLPPQGVWRIFVTDTTGVSQDETTGPYMSGASTHQPVTPDMLTAFRWAPRGRRPFGSRPLGPRSRVESMPYERLVADRMRAGNTDSLFRMAARASDVRLWLDRSAFPGDAVSAGLTSTDPAVVERTLFATLLAGPRPLHALLSAAAGTPPPGVDTALLNRLRESARSPTATTTAALLTAADQHWSTGGRLFSPSVLLALFLTTPGQQISQERTNNLASSTSWRMAQTTMMLRLLGGPPQEVIAVVQRLAGYLHSVDQSLSLHKILNGTQLGQAPMGGFTWDTTFDQEDVYRALNSLGFSPGTESRLHTPYEAAYWLRATGTSPVSHQNHVSLSTIGLQEVKVLYTGFRDVILYRPVDSTRQKLVDDWLLRNPGFHRRTPIQFTPAQAAAVYIYTTGAYKLFQAVYSQPDSVKAVHDQLLEFHKSDLMNDPPCNDSDMPLGFFNYDPIMRVLRARYQAAVAADADGDVESALLFNMRERIRAMAPAVLLEMKDHADMLIDALYALPPLHGPEIYRGVKRDPRLRPGDVYVPDSVISASRSMESAGAYLPSAATTGGAVLAIETRGYAARDIDIFSRYEFEKEIAILPGSRLVCVEVTYFDHTILGRTRRYPRYLLREENP